MNITERVYLGEVQDKLEFLATLVWRDKTRNACGIKAGDSGDAHMLEDALKRVKKMLKEK